MPGRQAEGHVYMRSSHSATICAVVSLGLAIMTDAGRDQGFLIGACRAPTAE